MNHTLPIHSRFNSKHIALPLFIWTVVMIIATCANVGAEEKDPYDFHGLFVFTFHALWILGVVLLLIVVTRKSITVTETKLIKKNVFGKVIKEYLLDDITDMSWNNRPRRVGGRSSSALVGHQSVVLDFKSGEELYLDIDDYSNLPDIRSFLFDHCKKEGIITIRSLGERKRIRKFRI